ncbi:MAG: NRDE family protein, partial [Bacteroidetes bacterium]|nr:NRDE family protein [Bacteroidota bacterium]
MCTVTYIPDGPDACHLTSNRDERKDRARALPPRRYGNIVYPKDPVAGGSWVALTRDGDAGVLLNGAFVKHAGNQVYRKSRGLVFLDIIHAQCPVLRWHDIDLEGIEPFTLVLFIQKKLWECRWDGQQRYMRSLDTARPHIWSSVTLYDEAARAVRERMLVEWYRQEKVSTDSILNLHRGASIQGKIATASITTVHIGRRKAKL